MIEKLKMGEKNNKWETLSDKKIGQSILGTLYLYTFVFYLPSGALSCF